MRHGPSSVPYRVPHETNARPSPDPSYPAPHNHLSSNPALTIQVSPPKIPPQKLNSSQSRDEVTLHHAIALACGVVLAIFPCLNLARRSQLSTIAPPRKTINAQLRCEPCASWPRSWLARPKERSLAARGLLKWQSTWRARMQGWLRQFPHGGAGVGGTEVQKQRVSRRWHLEGRVFCVCWIVSFFDCTFYRAKPRLHTV
ncbi:hypothetical protein BS50DRAFT_193599 [Corynespora cassiicola Philippines]|uniref:Uncharacterized protein n=1 Tax=Corynespora cassiicola Philippines TaxID=1448308 RepID=A0A2T2P7T4_CORCC|nr:hypothetical protein BS50DRAFT_193599 [Corynespora cassiicola Philippines]